MYSDIIYKHYGKLHYVSYEAYGEESDGGYEDYGEVRYVLSYSFFSFLTRRPTLALPGSLRPPRAPPSPPEAASGVRGSLRGPRPRPHSLRKLTHNSAPHFQSLAAACAFRQRRSRCEAIRLPALARSLRASLPEKSFLACRDLPIFCSAKYWQCST